MQVFLFTILGALLGSFSAWLGRSLMDRKGFPARSACDACRRQLAWWELIPVFSFLGLGGRCRTCKTGIAITDWSMEIIGALLFGLGAWRFTDHRDFVWWILISLGTILLFYIDVRWMIVPRAFAVVVALVAVMAQWSPDSIAMVALSGLLGAIFYFLLYAVSRGRWVGDGDVGLGLIVGILVGNPINLGFALLIAHVFGALVALFMLATRRRQFGDALPMGAFLIPAMWIVVLWLGWAR